MGGVATVEQVFPLVGEALVGAVEVMKRTAYIEAVVLVKYHEPKQPTGNIGKQELVAVQSTLSRRDSGIESALPIVLRAPAQGQKVETPLGGTQFRTGYQVITEVACTADLFGVAGRYLTGSGGEVGFPGPVAPEGTPDAEEVVTADGDALVVADTVGLEGVLPEYGGPLAAVVDGNAAVTVHHPRHGRIQVEGRHIELRKVDVLRPYAKGKQAGK